VNNQDEDPMEQLSALAETHVARFATLQPMESMRTHDLPLDVRDKIWSRKLLPAVSPRGLATPFGAAPVRDQDFSITFAVCPPGTGPSLHTHHRTTETFTCLRGRFEFRWGDRGEHATILEPFDLFAVPPLVARAFRNISDEEGVLQVLITGGIHDMQDIAFPAQTAAEIRDVGPGYVETFETMGLRFGDAPFDPPAGR
jgi:mannose-6-phosphate isomerase-like protein (cupin superfamily)